MIFVLTNDSSRMQLRKNRPDMYDAATWRCPARPSAFVLRDPPPRLPTTQADRAGGTGSGAIYSRLSTSATRYCFAVCWRVNVVSEIDAERATAM